MRQPNIVVIVSDTLRACELGCYGSTVVQTPNLDAFAADATRFTHAFPEALPTIPVRRGLHTGRRAFPFRNYSALKWDIVYLPGWQPLSNDEDTLAENLAQAGYHTGFITDTLPYFAPGMNFTRGFWQWDFVRGQQQDRWKSPHTLPAERLARYGDVAKLQREKYGLVSYHLANTAHVKQEEDTSTARVFSSAMNFLTDNQSGQPFYLLVDCFDPHEPWEAPEKYYRLYGNPDYRGRRLVHCGYGPARDLGYTRDEVGYVHAQYRGLVTLVDTWFGKFMRKLQELDLAENTAVIVISDHGTNFCDNPRDVIGKPDYALYPGVMNVPLMARLPGESGARVSSEFIYNLDVPATVYDLAGVKSAQGTDGQSLVPLLRDAPGWKSREYVTCRYGGFVCCIDRHSWVITDLNGQARDVYDLEADPRCMTNIVNEDNGRRSQGAWLRILQDAGGELPRCDKPWVTNAIGEQSVRRNTQPHTPT